MLLLNRVGANAAHILIKHINSKKPFDKLRNKEIKRSLEDAISIL